MSGQIEFDLSPSKLPPDLRAAIGFVIAAASQTENIINMAIAGCLGIDMEYAVGVTQHMPLPLKFDVLYSVAEIRIDGIDALDELDKLLEIAKTSLDKRNGIAHDAWGVSKADRTAYYRIKQSARGSVKADPIPVTVDEINADGRAIESAGLSLIAFLNANGLFPALPPSRPRGHKLRAARKKRRPPPVVS